MVLHNIRGLQNIDGLVRAVNGRKKGWIFIESDSAFGAEFIDQDTKGAGSSRNQKKGEGFSSF